MSKNNKARRAAKAKQRAQRRARHTGQTSGWSSDYDSIAPTPRQQVVSLWFQLELTWRDGGDLGELSHALAGRPAALADGVFDEAADEQLGVLWQHGWQPAELRRHARHQLSAAGARLIELAILAEHDRARGRGVDDRWAAQLREFKLRDLSTTGGCLPAWRDREGLSRPESYATAAAALGLLGAVPPLDVLIAPPGAAPSAVYAGPPAARGDAQGDSVLRRVRKLLSKAESSEFDEEAAALMAKAHELMTRHAIDHALLATPGDQDVPRMVRLPIDPPYADAKSLLLAVVAEANRSRAVYLGRLEMSTVVGHADDLVAVEMLFISLLVQAQNALAEAGRSGGVGRRARSQSFRSSFFLAYARRIEERLAKVAEQIVDEAGEASARFLPVLRAREDAVAEAVETRFGDSLVTSNVRGGYDYAGSAFGRRAADDARFDAGELS